MISNSILFQFALAIVSLAVFANCALIIPPLKTDPQYEAGLIYVQGADIVVKDYIKFSRSLQDKFNGRLWVAIVDFPLNLPEPVLVDSVLHQTLNNLREAHFNVTQDTPIFIAGHSLGGATIQNYLLNNNTIASFPAKLSGIILLGEVLKLLG
jgi:hypothetical protein